ncbi:MAG: phenylalanine--tRNA ligase subunit beta [Promethearchaeota archaeon]
MIVDVRISDLLNLIGKQLTLEELEENLFLLKCELERVVDGIATIEVNPDRVDMLSTEGIARALRGFLEIEMGVPKYRVYSSKWQAIVESSVADVRPYLACGIVRGVDLTSDLIAEYMQFQERLTSTFGRSRKKASIGLYELDLIKPPIYYRTASPNAISFIPLEGTDVMTAKQILRSHPKGQEFGVILEGFSQYPVLIDSEGQVLSLPPIINSNDLGRIVDTTRNLFVEVTGTHKPTTIHALNIMIAALAERGGRIAAVETVYPQGAERLPNLSPQRRSVSLSYVNTVLGYQFDGPTVAHCLARMRMDCTSRGDTLRVAIPQYRVDILHDIDIVEDIAIGYGFNRIEPTLPNTMTIGGELPMTTLRRTIRDLMVGLGYQEIWTYVLTNIRTLFEKMNLPPSQIVEISNPKSTEYHVARDRLLPGVLAFLGENSAQELPQRVFEAGDVVIVDSKAETQTQTLLHLAAALVDSRVDITKLKAELFSFLQNLGLTAEVTPISNPSFIDGRVGAIHVAGRKIGIIGEVHPVVLANYGIEAPCMGFELEIIADWAS